jgi:serine protease Do
MAKMIRFLVALLAFAASACAFAAAPASAPGKAEPRDEEAKYQFLRDAANAVVGIKVKALANARSAQTLGVDRFGSGALIDNDVVLTIGYLVLEADQVDIVTPQGRSVPATVAAYDHATGFGLIRPLVPLQMKPIKLGNSTRIEPQHRMLVAAAGGEDNLSVATVVARRKFAGYWEYLIDGAIFTSPPRADFGGAALIDRHGELVGIGSLFVMDAEKPGERAPGNMFVPIDLLKPILAEMLATGRQKAGVRPWIGVSSVEEDGRLKVIRVSGDGPADKAGIAPGDIILALSGEKVEKLDDFYKRLWATGSPGVVVTLKVLKGTEVHDIRVRTIDRVEHVRKKPTI